MLFDLPFMLIKDYFILGKSDSLTSIFVKNMHSYSKMYYMLQIDSFGSQIDIVE